MSKHEIAKAAFAKIVESERVRHEQRHGRGHGSVESEAARRIKQAGGKVSPESIESWLEYLKETED